MCGTNLLCSDWLRLCPLGTLLESGEGVWSGVWHECEVCCVRLQVGVMADFLDTASVKQLHFIDPVKAGRSHH